jgi:hypothetical protein
LRIDCWIGQIVGLFQNDLGLAAGVRQRFFEGAKEVPAEIVVLVEISLKKAVVATQR